MPQWDFHLSSALLSNDEMESLSKTITRIYTRVGLPPFYVQVRFIEDKPSNVFIGGEKHPKFVALTISHLARTFETDEQKKRFLDKVDQALNPIFQTKGLDWEYYVQESPRDLWKINGLVPPPSGSAMEKKWVQFNKPVVEHERL